MAVPLTGSESKIFINIYFQISCMHCYVCMAAGPIVRRWVRKFSIQEMGGCDGVKRGVVVGCGIWVVGGELGGGFGGSGFVCLTC